MSVEDAERRAVTIADVFESAIAEFHERFGIDEAAARPIVGAALREISNL